MVIFSEATIEPVEAFGPGLFGIIKFFEALVDFDTWYNALTGEKIDEILAIIGVLVSSFVEENDAIDVIYKARGSKEDITVVATIVVGIWDI